VVALFPITLIVVYLSDGLNVDFDSKHGVKNKKDEKARLDRRTVFTVSPVSG